MRLGVRTLLLPLLLVLALTLGVRAEECVPTGPGHEVELPAAGTVFYVDNDLCQLECVASLWVYQETNGIDGLQRGDHVQDDTCGGTVPPDTRLVLLYAASP